jgi:hypothetical protein
MPHNTELFKLTIYRTEGSRGNSCMWHCATIGRSLVRFQMNSLDLSIELIHLAHIINLGPTQPLTERNIINIP